MINCSTYHTHQSNSEQITVLRQRAKARNSSKIKRVSFPADLDFFNAPPDGRIPVLEVDAEQEDVGQKLDLKETETYQLGDDSTVVE